MLREYRKEEQRCFVPLSWQRGTQYNAVKGEDAPNTVGGSSVAGDLVIPNNLDGGPKTLMPTGPFTEGTSHYN